MLELTHVHVLFRNSHLADDFNFNVNEQVRVEVEVYVDFATSLVLGNMSDFTINPVYIWRRNSFYRFFLFDT